MTLWLNSQHIYSERADTDLDWFWVSETPVPPRRTMILRLDGWYLVPEERELLLEALGNPAYDWSKIAAVFIDEPYLTTLTNPDNPGDPRKPAPANPCDQANSAKTVAAEVALATVADRVRTLSPATRFWVNFSKNEMDWMHRGFCDASFNQPYIDVVSVDYYRPFYDVKPYYDRLKANPATPYQQRALMPLVGYKLAPQPIDPVTAAYWLQGYFDYATAENQTCDLPIGRTGVTGIADRCSVWIVGGWPGVDYEVDSYVGFYNPASAPIRQAWQQQRQIIRADQMNLVFDLTHTILDSPDIP